MSTKNIGTLSIDIAANAAKAVSGFKQADAAARSTAASIDREVDKMQKSVARKFTGTEFGKDLLKGLGIGSGFGLAMLAVEKWVDVWRESAEYIKDLETRAQSIAAAMQATSKAAREAFIDSQGPERQRAARVKEAAELEQRMLALETRRASSIRAIAWMGAGNNVGLGIGNLDKRVMEWQGEKFGNATNGIGVNDFTALMLKRADDAQEAWNKLRGDLIKARSEVAKLDKEIEAGAAKAAKETTDQVVRLAQASAGLNKLQTDYEGAAEAEARGVDAARAWNEEMATSALRFRELANPSQKFTKQMDEINDLFRHGKLQAGEAAEAIAAVKRAMANDEANRVDAALDDFFGPLDAKQKDLDAAAKKTAKGATELGWAFSSAFEDAILSGEKLGDVIKGLGQDILRIAVRTAITQPIGQALGNLVSAGLGGFFGGGKATGGPVSAGTTYLVGEQGPELFRPSGAGTIVPNHKLGGVGSGGHVFNIDARGADRTGLARLESMIREINGSIELRAVAAVGNENRRRI